MTARPKLLDLFCGAGGAAMGYYRAGFDVVGVDIKPQKNYPFEFIQADAMTFPLEGFDAIHASPPCQAHSAATAIHGDPGHPRLIEPTRERLWATGRPYVIENVMRAPLKGPWLCGRMFGLRLFKHRRFETNWLLCVPAHEGHGLWRTPKLAGRGSRGQNTRPGPTEVWQLAGHFTGAREAGAELGMEWMTQHDLAEAIPPAYTEYIGKQLMAILNP